MRTLKCGDAAASFGDLGHEFFVIERGAQRVNRASRSKTLTAGLREGSIEVVISTGALKSQGQQGQGKSAAAAAATFSMADRIRRPLIWDVASGTNAQSCQSVLLQEAGLPDEAAHPGCGPQEGQVQPQLLRPHQSRNPSRNARAVPRCKRIKFADSGSARRGVRHDGLWLVDALAQGWACVTDLGWCLSKARRQLCELRLCRRLLPWQKPTEEVEDRRGQHAERRPARVLSLDRGEAALLSRSWRSQRRRPVP